MSIPWLEPSQIGFPAVDRALEEPNGLLAAGGDLTPDWLIAAYQRGIFPWYESGQPILWWTPDPRMVLFLEQLHVSRSLKRFIRQTDLICTFDKDFPAVLQACSEPRRDSEGSWITEAMKQAYTRLHSLGLAHSVETWDGDRLVGGLYGVALGRLFFGESMFSRQSNASKLALAFLVEQLRKWDYQFIDCQLTTRHLASLGAREISRHEFVGYLEKYVGNRRDCDGWVEV